MKKLKLNKTETKSVKFTTETKTKKWKRNKNES